MTNYKKIHLFYSMNNDPNNTIRELTQENIDEDLNFNRNNLVSLIKTIEHCGAPYGASLCGMGHIHFKTGITKSLLLFFLFSINIFVDMTLYYTHKTTTKIKSLPD